MISISRYHTVLPHAMCWNWLQFSPFKVGKVSIGWPVVVPLTPNGWNAWWTSQLIGWIATWTCLGIQPKWRESCWNQVGLVQTIGPVLVVLSLWQARLWMDDWHCFTGSRPIEPIDKVWSLKQIDKVCLVKFVKIEWAHGWLDWQLQFCCSF